MGYPVNPVVQKEGLYSHSLHNSSGCKAFLLLIVLV